MNKSVLFINHCRQTFNSLFTIQPSFQHYVTCAKKSTIKYNLNTRNKPWSMALNNATQQIKLIHLYSYNKSQQDALFLRFILIKYSTHFRQIYCPSWVSTLCGDILKDCSKGEPSITTTHIAVYTRWFKYDRDYLCVNKPVTVPVIFEPPCITVLSGVANTQTILPVCREQFCFSEPRV